MEHSLICKLRDNLCIKLVNLFRFSFVTILVQYVNNLDNMFVSNGILPTSPYVIALVVRTTYFLKDERFLFNLVARSPYFTNIEQYWNYCIIKYNPILNMKQAINVYV